MLEVGCGPGALLAELSRQVRSVCGVDLAENMLAQAHASLDARRYLNVCLCAADAELLPFPADNFSLLVCRYCFANFPAPQNVVAEMRRVMRPGGRLAVVETVAPAHPPHRRRLNRLERLRSSAPTRMLALEDLVALFRQSGLHLLDCHVLCRRQPLDDWLALSEKGQDRRGRRLLKQEVLRLAKKEGDLWPLCRQNGCWGFSYEVVRLLWRK